LARRGWLDPTLAEHARTRVTTPGTAAPTAATEED
jgi:hypothetical protein